MAIRFYLQPDADPITEWHNVPFYGEERPFNYCQMKEAMSDDLSLHQWPNFAPGQESYPTNFPCKDYSSFYRKSSFITQGTDLWDALQAEGLDRIPHGIWTLLGYFHNLAVSPSKYFYFKIEVHKRTPDPSPFPSPSPSDDIEVKLFEWFTGSYLYPHSSLTYSYSSPYKSAYSVNSNDRLVVKIFGYYNEIGESVGLQVGELYPIPTVQSYLELPETPSPSPSPSPSPTDDFVGDGNLFTPVDAPVKLNDSHEMLSTVGHDPKYVLDNNVNTYWEPDSTSDRALYFDAGSQVTVDAIAFWIHNYNAGLGADKSWRLSYSTDDITYTNFDIQTFELSRNGSVPLIVLKFAGLVTARYWKFQVIDFDKTPVGPAVQIGGVWLMNDYSLPYDNQYPELNEKNYFNRVFRSPSGISLSSQRHEGFSRVFTKKYVFVTDAHSDLLSDAFKASKGGILPIAVKPNYDSDDWFLCQFISKHNRREINAEVYEPDIKFKEIGFKRVSFTDHSLPHLSTTVGHWKFNNDLTDTSSNGNTLTPVGVPGGVQYTYGICDYEKTCVLFARDGLLERAAGGATSLDMGSSDFSIEIIFATDPVPATTYITHKVGGNPGYFIALTTAGKLDVYVGDASGGQYGFGYGLGLDDGEFHYVVMTVNRTSDELKMYVDGVQVGTALDISSVTGDISNPSFAFQIGRVGGGGDEECINGPLDEVCMSKQLLTANQITQRWLGFSNSGNWGM